MHPTHLAMARIQVADIVRLCNRRLNAAGYHAAAALLVDCAMDVAEQYASERAESGSALRADFSGPPVVGTVGENPTSFPTEEP